MATLDPIELKASSALQDQQAGAGLNAFNRPSQIRHAQLDTWWERGLAVFVLGCLAYALISLVVRHL